MSAGEHFFCPECKSDIFIIDHDRSVYLPIPPQQFKVNEIQNIELKVEKMFIKCKGCGWKLKESVIKPEVIEVKFTLTPKNNN